MSGAPGAPAEGGQGAEGTPPASPPASPPATPPAEGASPPAPPSPPAEPPAFHTRFADPEERGYAENKGWKNESDLLKSYRNLEKLRGVPQERLLTLPENLQDADAMKPILDRLGLSAPAEAKDYGLATIEGVNPEAAAVFEQLAHKHNVPKPLAQAFMKDIVEFEAKAQAALEQKETEEAAQERGRFHAKYGMRAEEKMESGRRFARALGFTDEQLENIETQTGVFDFWEIMARGGEKMGEGSFVDGVRKPGFDMTPEAAKVRIQELGTNAEWRQRYLNGDKAAAAEMRRLQEIAHPGVKTT